MQKTKNHYLQKAYLRRFSDTQVIPPHKQHVWVYDKMTYKWKKKGVDNIGYINHLYSLKSIDGKTLHHIEDYFNECVEQPNLNVFNKILSKASLDTDDRLLFSMRIHG